MPSSTLFVWALILASTADFAAAFGQWSSSAHFGFAANRSRTNSESRGGSSLFLDAENKVEPDLSFGLRTAALGVEGSFYRLASGPILKWRPYHTYQVEIMAGAYSESGQLPSFRVNPTERSSYISRGFIWGVGWERKHVLSKNLEWSWGGFWMTSSGPMSSEVTNLNAGTSIGSHLWSDSRGLKISLRMLL